MQRFQIGLAALAIVVMAFLLWRIETMPRRIVDRIERISAMDCYETSWVSAGQTKKVTTCRQGNETNKDLWERHQDMVSLAQADCPPD